MVTTAKTAQLRDQFGHKRLSSLCALACCRINPGKTPFFMLIPAMLYLLTFGNSSVYATRITPGSGFTGATSEPARIGSSTDSGYDANTIARWDVVPYQDFNSVLNIGVVAFHIAGINRVEFSAKGGPWASVSTMTLNPQTGIVEYWVELNAADCNDGLVEVRAIAYPNVGKPRIVTTPVGNGWNNWHVSDDPLYLYANHGGTLENTTKVIYVKPSDGNDSNPGTHKSPMQTIGYAIDKFGSGTCSGGGRIVLLEEGNYPLYAASRGSFSMVNSRYITVESDAGLDRNDVILTGLNSAGREACIPRVAKMHWKGVTFDFDTMSYSQYQGSGVDWFDNCRLWQRGGWVINYPDDAEASLYRVKDLYGTQLYFTDCRAEDNKYGFCGAKLARNCSCYKISADTFANAEVILNCTISKQGAIGYDWHPDIWQIFEPAKQNCIMYGLYADGEIYGGAAIGSVDLMLFDNDNASEAEKDFAIVDVYIHNDFEPNDPYESSGGPIFTQFFHYSDNVYFRNVRWLGQRVMFRENYTAHNVLFDNCQFFPLDYTTYVINGNAPPGVTFRNCYNTVPGPNSGPPHADAGPDQNCIDSDRNGSEQVTLDGSGSSDPNGSIVSYIWSEGGSQIATGVNPTVTLPVGRHTIKLTVTNDRGHTSTDTLTVTVQLEDGLIKYFKFDECSGVFANDSSGFGNTGFLINGPTWTAQGEISFDGNNNTVEITTADVNFNRGTIALWAYPDAFSKNKHSLFGHVLSQSNRIQLYCNAAGSLNVGLGDNATASTNIQNLNAHDWYHIALVWDQGNYRVYVDGVTRSIGTYAGLSSLATYADIGNSGNRSDRTEGFDGLIDEVRLYNKPLSDDEIAEIALVFLPIGDKTMSAGEELSFTVRTKSGSNVEISDTNLPSTPYFASNLFRWTSDYNDSGVYEVNFIAPHGLSTDREDFEKIAISVTNISLPNTASSSSWDNGSGDIYYNFNGNLYIWDLSGSYSYKTGDWQLDYVLKQDASGKITGTGTASNSASNSCAAVPITLKGVISGSAAVKMTLKGTSVKGRIKGTVNGGSKAISGTAKINRQSAFFTAPLPANMDGSATLSLSCTSSGKSRFGTGEQTLSNGESYNFGIKGKYNAKSNESTLTLKGSAKGSSLKLKVDGSDGTIKTLKGKMLGQKLNATNIVP